MADSFVKVPKDGVTETLWKEPRRLTRFEAWLDLLRRAAWSTHDEGDTRLRPGWFIASLSDLSAAWNWHTSMVGRFMEWLIINDHVRVVGSETYGPAARGRVYAVVFMEGDTLSDIQRDTLRDTLPSSPTTPYKKRRDTKRDTRREKESDTLHSGLEDRKEEVTVPPVQANWPARAAAIWQEHSPGAVISIPKLGKLLFPLVKKHGGFEHVESAWSRFCSSPERDYSAGYFAEHYDRYNGSAPPPKPPAGPAWKVAKESEERDQNMNRDPRIQQTVSMWLQSAEKTAPEDVAKLKYEAKVAGRWFVPYVYDKLTGGSSELSSTKS